MIYLFWSCANRDEAAKIIQGLLEERLIACASFFPVESIYSWKGKIEHSKEIKVILKTRKGLFGKIDAYIRSNCSYEVPEIAEVGVGRVSKKYLQWIEETINKEPVAKLGHPAKPPF